MFSQRLLNLAFFSLLGTLVFAAGPIFLHETFGIALWSVVAAIILLPVALAADREPSLDAQRYIAACLPIVLGVLILVGFKPAIIIAAVAASLVGGAQLLIALRVPATLAIAATVFGASLSFTWPIWSAGLLATYDLGPWLQRIVNISPAFALNAAIAPADPLTHRPLAYRLMNLGQDVSYAMPTSLWPCVLLHAGVGATGAIGGMVGRRWTRINADAKAVQQELSS